MSDRLFRWTHKKTRTGTFVGVVVERLKRGGMHAGLIYRTETSRGAYVVHLWSHRKLYHDPPCPGQVCILPNIEAIRLPAVAALARRIYRKNSSDGIPYGFSSPDLKWFNAQGQVIVGGDRLGLTCSHLVLAIFREAGFPLARLDTWAKRPEDAEWQKDALKFYKSRAGKNKRKLKRLGKVKTQIGTVRCRPIEVGGAALSDEIPCSFDSATENAKQIEPLLTP